MKVLITQGWWFSFLAIEEDVIANDGKKAKTVKQPLPLPENVSDAAVGFDMEIDEEDMSFSFHKEIVVDGYLELAQEEILISEITDQLIFRLNGFLGNQGVMPDSIEFTINHKGEIEKVSIEGKSLTKEYMAELEKLILKTKKINNPSEGLLKISVLF